MRKPIVVALALVMAGLGAAVAQDYPNRPATMIIPFAAGGPQDQVGRVLGQRMGELLGQQVVIENVGGAGGMTGSKRVADAPPDGYMFVLASVGTHAQGQTLYKKPLYNAVTDFTPVALMVETPIALITRKDFPANNLKEFAAYAKANESKLQYGHAGPGSATHLGCVVLNHFLGLKAVEVPYRGMGPAMQDLLAGRLDYACDIINTAKVQIDAGNVKGIALMDKERSPALPNLPTGAEQGFANLEAYTWSAIFLPKGAPDAVVKKLNGVVVQTLKTPSVKEALGRAGAQIVADERTTPEYLGRFLKEEIEKWAVPIKASGVTVE